MSSLSLIDSLDYEIFSSDKDQLPEILSLITLDLSEPYNLYTIRYFLYSWPWLTHLLYTREHHQLIGVVIGRLTLGKTEPYALEDERDEKFLEGYIAMLVIHPDFRQHGLGSALVQKLLQSFDSVRARRVTLETEANNLASLKLYDKLGFRRQKRLPNYYWSGSDAYRLYKRLE